MQTRVSVVGPEIDAYIITSFDEHLNDHLQEFDQRHVFISNFTGKVATVVVTMKSVALWTDERFLSLANEELDCDWHIFKMEESPTVAEWLGVIIVSFIFSEVKYLFVYKNNSKNYILRRELGLIQRWCLTPLGQRGKRI